MENGGGVPLSTLLEALSSNTYDLQNKRDLSTNFSRDLIRYRGNIIDAYLKDKQVDLNQKIAELATASQLNDEQIKRLIEEVNNQVYLILYNRMRESKERNVSFNLATFQKIKEIMDKKKTPEKKEKSASVENGSMEKTASETEPVNSLFNGNSVSDYGFAGALSIEQDKFSYIKHACQKIASDYLNLQDALEKNAEQAAHSAMLFGSGLVKYSTMQKNANEIFEEVCRKENLSTDCQKFLISACQESIKEKTAAYQLPEQYQMKISYCNPNQKPLSLNQYSLNKEASDKFDLPVIFERDTKIDGFPDLTKFASDVSYCISAAKDMKEKIASYDAKFKEANLGFEDVKKMGEYGNSWGMQSSQNAK